jgi:hypothetical protein
MSDAEKAQAMIKAVYDDGEMEINGRQYRFTSMQHKQRRRVFAYYTHVMGQVQGNDFSFLDSPEFEKVEQVIDNAITYNGSLLSRIGDAHWDKYPDDYLQYVTVAMGVISYPFLSASHTA